VYSDTDGGIGWTHVSIVCALIILILYGIYSFIQSPTIRKYVHQFSNPDLQHSSTEDTISNHSITLTVSAICLTGRHMAHFFTFVYLRNVQRYNNTFGHMPTNQHLKVDA